MQLADCVAWSVCGGTAHVDMYIVRCCQTGDFSPGGVLFPGPKNDAAVD